MDVRKVAGNRRVRGGFGWSAAALLLSLAGCALTSAAENRLSRNNHKKEPVDALTTREVPPSSALRVPPEIPEDRSLAAQERPDDRELLPAPAGPAKEASPVRLPRVYADRGNPEPERKPVESQDLPQSGNAQVRLVSGSSMAPLGAMAATLEANRHPVQPQPSPRVAARTAEGVVREVGHAAFERQVLQSKTPVLVDFYASWCGPCRALAPTLQEVAAESPHAVVVKVNVDHNPELAARYGVKSLPSLMVFKDGRVVAQQKGVVSKSRLLAMLDL